MAHVLRSLFVLLIVLIAGMGVGACTFGPSFGDGAIACSADPLAAACPPGLVCLSDGRCHSLSTAPTDSDRKDGGTDSGPSNLFITDTSVLEGNTGSTDAIFTVRLIPASSRPVRVDFETVDDTATAPTDYVKTAGSLFFEPGSTAKPLIVKVKTNDQVQPTRRFFVTLKNPSNADITIPKGSGTILDDDSFGIVASDVSVVEGTNGVTNAIFDVHLTGASMHPVSVFYSTEDGSAKEGSDYFRSNGRLLFLPGEENKIVTVPIRANTQRHAPERTFFLTLTNPTGNAPILRGRAEGKIVDDDPLPTITINDVTIDEGQTGFTTATFHVRLSSEIATGASVAFTTTLGTADSTDIGVTSGVLTFEPGGEIEKRIAVSIYGDTKNEDDETFTVNLSDPTSATITKAIGTGTIRNDDQPPRITIDDLALPEGMQGSTTTFPFRVRLSEPSGKPITFHVDTENETAMGGTDFVALSALNQTIPPGATTHIVNVTVNGDNVDEAVERFSVRLSSLANATPDRVVARGTILNDDSTLPSLTISDVRVSETNTGGSVATFSVTLSGPPTPPSVVTVQYTTADETAKADSDYVTTSGVLTFTPGQVTKTISVPIFGDNTFEADETFLVRLSNASPNANIADGEGRCTIVNDDLPPSISIAGVSALEGLPLVFTVNLDSPSGEDVVVTYNTVATGSALPALDYQSRSGTLLFRPGETAKAVRVFTIADNTNEPDETFTLTLSSPTGATLANALAIGTIRKDDALPVIAIGADVSESEGAAGATTGFAFPVTLTRPSSTPITVNYATTDGTAAAATDYITTTGSLTFAPGEVSKIITVPVKGDADVEQAQRLTLSLSAPSTNAVLGRAQAKGTIANDDAANPAVTPTMTVSDATILEGASSGSGSGSGSGAMLTFKVTLSAKSTQQVSVHFTTEDGSAKSGNDYVAADAVLTFAAGETEKTINIAIQGDTTREADETMFVTLSDPVNAVIFHGRGQGTIVNDD